jgi:ribosome-associated protein
VTSTPKRVDRDVVADWASIAALAADDKQALDTVVLEVGAVLAITDFFVITSATNSRQVRTIAEAVEERLKENGGPVPLRIEGRSDLTWVLLDYGDLVVHVFLDEVRRFYDIERLYRDVPVIDWRTARANAATQ